MSESLRSWLFNHATTSALTSLSDNYDLSDIPSSRKSSPDPSIYDLSPDHHFHLCLKLNSSSVPHNSDIWALIGDRTHCLAAASPPPPSNDSTPSTPLIHLAQRLLLTLTAIRITVARVQIAPSLGDRSGLPYRPGQYSLVLDVRGFEVVSSINEPVWFGGVRSSLVRTASRQQQMELRRREMRG